jgi:D-glycero-alpha-D-manno-heptose-7-phosphate kinase
MVDALEEGNILEIGRLLNEGWMLKREMTQMTTNLEIDRYYERGLELGALGGKVLGAGGGGFMLMCVPEQKQEYFKANFPLREVNFEIDNLGVIDFHF